MSSHSDETKKFRSLSVDEKFASVIQLCETIGAIPKTYSRKHHSISQSERVRGQFYVNMHSAMNRGELEPRLHHYIHTIAQYGSRISVGEKIDNVFDFYLKHCRLPTHMDAVSIANQWKSIKCLDVSRGHALTRLQKARFKSMCKFANKVSHPSKLEKLSQLLAYCAKHAHKPKQHSSNAIEKKMADFLSTVTQKNKSKPLTGDELIVYNKINEYPRAPRDTNPTRRRHYERPFK